MHTMRRVAMAAIATLALATTSHAMVEADSSFVKKGFSFGILPAISYDSDLGFQYGVLSNL